jgi:hypothetical protein
MQMAPGNSTFVCCVESDDINNKDGAGEFAGAAE